MISIVAERTYSPFTLEVGSSSQRQAPYNKEATWFSIAGENVYLQWATVTPNQLEIPLDVLLPAEWVRLIIQK